MKALLPVAVFFAACAGEVGEPETGSTTQELSSIVTNGSFETGDYTGWSLSQTAPIASFETWGVATDGQVVNPGGAVFDFFDRIQVGESSPGLPITYHATDGQFVALALQSGGGDMRMSQVIALPACQPLVLWDMFYNNHTNFDPNFQFIAVNVRNPVTDAVLATVFKTTPGAPLVVSPMTPFQADLNAFSGQTVKLDFEQEVNNFFFDAAYDNIRVICKGLSASPGALDFGAVNVNATSPPKPLTITNFAPTPLTIQATTISGPFALSTGLAVPVVLAPGESTGVAITFHPLTTGTQTGTLTFASTDPNGPTVVSLTGVGSGTPQLDVLPGNLAFPDVQVGDASTPQSLTLVNLGPVPLTITAASVPAPFVVTGGLPVTLAPGDNSTIDVTFAPIAGGPVTASLEIDSDDPTSPTLIAVTGTGESPAITMTGSLSFGDQRVGTTSAGQTVHVTNSGVGSLTIDDANVPAQFAVSGLALPITLAASESVDFTVSFAPIDEGPATGQLVVTSTAPPASVALDGTGIAPHLAVTSPVLFGNQRVGTTGAQSVIVTNTGTDTLTVASAGASPPYAAFTTPFSLAPNTSATIPITFTPLIEGPQPGTLTIASDDAASPTVVGLIGTGVVGKVAISPGAVNFAPQRVGTISDPQVVTVTNSGTDTLTIAQATLAPGPFTLVPLGGNVLPPGTSTQFSITFAPAAAGPANTVLSIVSDAPSSPDQAPVSGVGVEPIADASPATVAFGNQRVGTTSTSHAVVLQNTGTSTLTVTSIAAAAPFVATTPATPFTIAPGQSTSIGVVFAPTAAGPATGSVTFATDATVQPAIALTGTGIQPVVQASTTALAFGNQRVATTSASQLITLTNTGTASLSIASATTPAAFILKAPSSFPIGVLPGGHAIFTVQFAPTATGVASGNVTINSDAASSPTIVAVSGTGVRPLLVVDPTSHDFGDIAVATTSAATTFTISNPGTDAFTVASVALAAPFSCTSLALPATVAPGGSLSFDVVFAPVAHISFASAITIATDLGFTSVPLTGRGVAPLIAGTPTALDFGAVPILTTSTLPVTLSNPGNAALSITALAFGGASSADYTLQGPPALPVTIPPGGSLALVIAFTPGDHGTRAAQLTATSNALGTPALVTGLTGQGRGPRGGVSPSSLTFAASNLTVAAPSRNVTVSNTGEVALVITSIVFGGANATDFSSAAVLPQTIAPGASGTVAFTFTPSAVGARAATATIITNDPLVPGFPIALTGIGQSPMIAVAPASLAFGGVRIGQAVTLPLVVSNPGTGPLTISAIDVSGPDGATISVAATALPLVLAPSSAHTLHVTFAPTVLASAAATLTILSDDLGDTSVAVPISGAGVSATVDITPSAVDFGSQLVGHTSAARQIHVHNVGTGGLSVLAVAVAGAQFTATSPSLPATLPGGAELVVSVTLAPIAIGAQAADLQITTDSPDAPDAVVHLAGLGISTAYSVSPSSLDFGTIHEGTVSAPLTVTLSNLSADPITLNDGVLAGGLPGDFSVTTVAGVLAPGATIAAAVTYQPASAAVSAATLTFGSADPAIPKSLVTLSGKAVSSFITVDHMAIDFGPIQVGDHTGDKSVAITNTTTTAISIANITSSDPQFVVDGSAALAPIAPGASTTFTIAFAPQTSGAAAAGVAITLQGAATPELTVIVSGEGTPPPSGGCAAAGGGGGWFGLGAMLLMCRRRRGRKRPSCTETTPE